MLSDGEWTYTWQHGRQLSGMSMSGTTVSFSYDADGLRTMKTVNGTATKYVYIGGQLTDITAGSDTLHIDYDSVGPASVKYNGTYYWYLRNAQGDVTGIVNSSGTRVVTYTYDAWGNILNTGGNMAGTLGTLNPLRYRGYVYDTETGLYYLQSRYYDPEICRFISADGYASTGQGLLGANSFAYCENNPVTRQDDSGEIWHIIAGIVGGAVIGGLTQVVTNIVNGKQWSEGLGVAVATGALSGALAASGVGIVGSILGNAAIAMSGNATNQVIKNDGFKEFNWGDMLIDGAIGALAGAAGGKGASRGNAKSAMSLGKQLTKRIVKGEIRAGLAYYSKNMMTQGGRSIYKNLGKSFVKGCGATIIAMTVKTAL